MRVERLYFAMVDPDEHYNVHVHAREDLEVLDLVISQSEGQFATAALEIPNPGVGLLSPLRKQYIFISCMFDGEVRPLFAGRIQGFPTDLAPTTIVVQYIAQSATWADDQAAFLETLKVAPFYSPLFSTVDKRSDPTEILAARNALLHWERFPDGGVSLSDIVQGSTTIDLGEGAFFDSLKTTVAAPAVTQVDVTVDVQWLQTGIADVDVGAAVKAKFVNTGGAPTPRINTLSPTSFESAWKGASVPSGYTVKSSVLAPVIAGIGAGFLKSPLAKVSSNDFPASVPLAHPVTRMTFVPRVWYDGTLVLTATYSQKRHETLSFSLASDTQPFSLVGDNAEALALKLQDPTAVDQGSVLAPTKPTFFYESGVLTPYGQAVVENALQRARARLTKTARAIETTFQTAISSLDLLDITCDCSVRIVHDALPGGRALGKVLGYSMHFSDQDQVMDVTIGSMVGTGLDSSGAGTPLAPAGYDNQFHSGIAATMDSAVVYSLDSPPAPTVPVDVGAMLADPSYCVDLVTVTNPGQSQYNSFASTAHPDTYLNAHCTGITVDLKSMNPSAELLLAFTLTTQPLTLPQHINLGAS